MPIYEYACKKCGHVFDVLQKMSDEPLSYCPECGAHELKKLISAPTFRLKGGGWYETDFKTSGKRNLAGDGSGTGKSDEAGKTDGGDAKPAAKPADSGNAAKSDGGGN